MRIVISMTVPDIDADVDPRFGRGPHLLVIDSDTLEWQAHPNPGASSAGGAGIQAAQFVTSQKADVVISGDFGPHAFQALEAAGMPMYVFGNCRTAREVVAQFKAGQLQRVGAATREDCHSEGQG
jgi:predicted Fe-Mo cluster-binding NifX family protein